MATEFYATLAHVLPILLLALMWDSEYLVRLRRQQRLPRRMDPTGVRFWTKPRVRIYALLVTGETVLSTAVAILVLARVIPDSRALRIALSVGLALLLITLLTRIASDVVGATAARPGPDASAHKPPEPAEPDATTPQAATPETGSSKLAGIAFLSGDV